MFVTHHRLSSVADGRVVYVAYTTLKDCDVMALVRNIAEKYLLLQNLENTDDENGTKKSSTSKNSTKKNGTKMESMTYLDFVRIVPNEFCEQYGLTKKVLDDLPRTYRGDTTLVSKSGIVNNLKNSADITMQQLARRKAVDAFSKQIGPVLNTIMAGWTFDQVTDFYIYTP